MTALPVGLLSVVTFLPALGAVVLAVINMVVAILVGVEGSGSFYRGVVARRISAGRGALPDTGTGLVILQIDGLSYHHMRHALGQGIMPNTEALMRDKTAELLALVGGEPG